MPPFKNTIHPGSLALGIAAGTLVQTETGARRIDTLRTGDKVLTRDAGMLSVEGIGVSPRLPRFCRPVRISAGALGNDHDLLVAVDHRLLWSDWRAELLFGTDAVLVRVGDLIGLDGITQAASAAATDCWTIQFDDHQLVMAAGLWTESLQTRATAAPSCPSQNARPTIAARYCLRSHEAEVLKAYCQGAAQTHIAAQIAA